VATTPPSTFRILQAGRGLAAMAVVLHHADSYVGQQIGALPAGLSRAMSFGYLGVDFFFVLSGFIIYYSNYARVSLPRWPAAYAESRLTRIYLPYLPVGVGLACVYTLLPGLRHADSDWGWLSSVTLLPFGAGPALHVAWTLQHEIIFYAVAFALLWTRRLLLGCVLWAILILCLLPRGYLITPGVSPIDLEFLAGIAVAWAFIRGAWLPLPIAAAAGAGGIASFFVLFGGDRAYSLAVGLGLAALLLPLVRGEARNALRVPSWLVLLGDASYAIYLVHVPLLSVVVRLGHPLHPVAAACVGIAASAAAGIAYHKLLEKPLLRAVRRLLHRRSEAAPAA
jgi:exopolysaccharide production protein ExoZ